MNNYKRTQRGISHLRLRELSRRFARAQSTALSPQQKMQKIAFKFSILTALTMFALIVFTQAAFAQQTLGDAIANVVFSSAFLPGLISAGSYLTGLVLGVLAIIKVKEHVDNPQQTPIWEPIKRFLAGGALFALPIVIEAAYRTIVGGSFFGVGGCLGPICGQIGLEIGGLAGVGQSGFTGAVADSEGLDAMIVRLMEDIWLPMNAIISGFAYLAGLIFVVIGILRLLKSSQDGPRGPGGIGTIFTFLTAGVLFGLDRVMGAFSTSITGSNVVSQGVSFAGGDGNIGLGNVLDVDAQGHVAAVISSVIAFMWIIGMISFVRGWFMLREFADSGGQAQNASMMAALTHIFGGAILVNLGPILNMVQNTLGITQYGFIFN